ncbi:MAG: DUF1330 domain-containing protein [Pseudomonadales bacterium]
MADSEAVYMLNALWFKPDGAAAYAAYASAAAPIVARLGGRRLDSFAPVASLIGDWKPDLFFVVEWPSWEAFRQLGEDSDYREIAHLRGLGLENSLLVRCNRLP